MKQVNVMGDKIEIPDDQSLYELAKKLEKNEALGALVNGELQDLREQPPEGAEIQFVTYEDSAGKHIYWHTASHVLAHAMQYYMDGDLKLAIGPPVDDGFYYDFDLPRNLSEDELENLEGIIQQIIQRGIPIERYSCSVEEARQKFKESGAEYKLELLDELDGEPSFYRQQDFEDLCGGPHLMSTGDLGVIKLTKLAGAYWRGDETGPMLQRVYGVAFQTETELEEYEKMLEEAKKRDHRRLGRELDLFHISEEVGPGLIIWHPRGAEIRQEIENYWRNRHREEGYRSVRTPHLAQEELWEVSGHLDHYKQHMFPRMEMDDRNYRVKPMNCPFHMQIFNSRTRSYRDLPIRYAELGTVYRYEKSGVLHGLLRVRGFTQDDAHIYCRPKQLEEELQQLLEFTTEILSTFGFKDYEIFVSTRPDDYVGSEDRWELATNSLKNALEEAGLDYDIDPGEGVYYGPKIDLKIRDSLDREWQCSTIQVDFNIPERFDVAYVDEDGEEQRPIMIHRALFGSIERFFGCLVEHYGGAFPPWLAPTPVWILPVDPANREYAEEIAAQFRNENINSSIQPASESLGKRIRTAIKQKIPYAIIVGSDEEEARSVEVRTYGEEESNTLSVDEAVQRLRQIIDSRQPITPLG